MSGGRALGLTMLALAAAGCAGSSGAAVPPRVKAPPASAPRVRASVPWLDRPVSVDNAVREYVQLGPPAAPPCAASQLVAGRPVQMQAVTGDQIAGAVMLRNAGKEACTVSGDAQLAVVMAGGGSLPVTEHAWPETLGWMPRWWGYPRVSIRPGASAWMQLVSVLGCGPNATTAEVELPGGAVPVRLTGRQGLRRPCYHPRDPLPVSVFMWMPQEAPQPPKPQIPLEVTLSAPRDVRPGELVRYRVTIGNGAAQPYRFGHCPAYWQGIRQGPHAEPVAPGRWLLGFRLNCAPVRTLLPMAERSFAMVLRIPMSASPGRGLLVWSFVPGLSPDNHSVGSATVQVDG